MLSDSEREEAHLEKSFGEGKGFCLALNDFCKGSSFFTFCSLLWLGRFMSKQNTSCPFLCRIWWGWRAEFEGKLAAFGMSRKTRPESGEFLLGSSRLCKSSQKDKKRRGISNDSVCLLSWETGWEWTVPCFGLLLNKPFSWIFSSHFQETFSHPTQEHLNPKEGWGRCCEFEITWNIENNFS